MTDAPGTSCPTIEVKDFGPIASGKVELRPLTVFAGPSNTGKSWLACLTYALTHRKIGGSISLPIGNDVLSKELGKRPVPEDPTAWAEHVEERSSIQLNEYEHQLLKAVVDDEVKAYGDQLLHYFSASEPGQLVREGVKAGVAKVTYQSPSSAVTTLSVRHGEISCSSKLPREILFPSRKSSSHDDIGPRVRERLGILLRNLQSVPKEERHHLVSARYLIRELVELLGIDSIHAFGKQSSTWYLPADRTGLMRLNRAVVTAIIRSASLVPLHSEAPEPALPGLLADFLDSLIRMNPIYANNLLDPQNLATSLESKVLGGAVEVETNEVGYPSFFWRPHKWDRALPMRNVSSMVSELAPVALYLRHYVYPGDMLILEEPEAHLHPAKQVELVNEIASWVRSGIQVVVTTHSEWVLDELANIVAAGVKGKPDGLDRNEVGLWWFEPGKRNGGSRIKEIRWDRDEGGYDTDFYDVATRLHNRWAREVEEDNE